MEPLARSEGYLHHEAQLYDRLGSAPGFPKKIWYGADSRHRILVLELVAYDLQNVFDRHPQCFTPDLVAGIAIQMARHCIDSMFYLH